MPRSSRGHGLPPRREAQQPRKSFCHTEAFSAAHSHSLVGWAFSVRQYILASSLSIFFSGQIHHFLKYFYIIATEQLWWHTTNVGLCFYILLQPAMKLHGGLPRHMHFKSLHITLESANWPSNEWDKFRSRDLSVYWYFNEWGNSTIILITLALSHAWELSCRPKWPHISLKCK